MRFHRRAPLAFPWAAVFLVASAAGTPSAAESVAGHWEGSVSYRGDEMPLRLDVTSNGGELAATIDLPSLVMAWQPASIRADGGGAVLDLPFGIGGVRLAPRDGAISFARATGKAALTLSLRRTEAPAIRAEEIRFGGNDAQLAGTLYRPKADGPVAAVVLIHGSETPTRASWSYRSWADFYVRHGIAALVYDRRGSGASAPMPESGDEGFSILAADAIAAVEMLAGAPGIDPNRIGLAGGSQAGWVSTLAATKSPRVAFLILTSVPAVTPADQTIQSATHAMRKDGLPEEAVQDAVAYLRLYFHVAATGNGWVLLRDARTNASGNPWADYVDQPEKPEDLRWWSRHLAVSPAAILPQVSVPVLALYGGADTIVPPEENAALFEHLLREGGNADVTVRTLPGADHRIELPMGRVENGRWKWAGISPEALTTIEQWLAKHALSR